jgi:hypothetical protein
MNAPIRPGDVEVRITRDAQLLVPREDMAELLRRAAVYWLSDRFLPPAGETRVRLFAWCDPCRRQAHFVGRAGMLCVAFRRDASGAVLAVATARELLAGLSLRAGHEALGGFAEGA